MTPEGIDILLHALAQLRRRGARFHACLVGGGSLLALHRRLVARLRLDDVATVVGPVPDSYPYLAGADVFVLPSLEEGGGSLSLLEALQAAPYQSIEPFSPMTRCERGSPGGVAALSRPASRPISSVLPCDGRTPSWA